MAEKSNDTSPSDKCSSSQHDDKAGGGWWDNWLTSAKTKSAEVYSMVKKDLDEIGTAVKSEASHVFSTTSNVIGKTLKLDEPESPANVMKKSFSSFIGQVSTVLSPEPDDEDITEVILASGDITMLKTYKKELEALQRLDATFIVAAYSAEFQAWRASLDNMEASNISPASAIKRLEASPILRAQYEKLVPDAVSHDEFWQRYLFRVALLQDKLAAASRKSPVTEPTADPVLAHLPLQTPIIESPKRSTSPTQNDLVNAYLARESWEEDLEDIATDIELTEEQQTLLLEEYDKELKKQALKNVPDKANNNTKDKTTITKGDKKTKSAQTKDKINNKNTDKKINKNGKSLKKVPKSDECGNNIVEDYFGDNKQNVIDDASSNSDESWEKEFDIEEEKKA